MTRIGATITARERVDFYWPPVAWAIWIFFISVQHWWAEWGVRHAVAESFGAFWLQLLVPVDLFVLATLVLPEREEDGKLDLGRWYERNRVWFFAIMFFLPALSIAEEIARTGRIASTLNLGFLLAFDAVIVAALLIKSRRVQEWITVQAMAMTVLYVGLLFLRLPS